VAILDSGNAALNLADPAAPLPINLPGGFANVGATAGPSTKAGSFASFNRALAAKAGVELAFAIARSPGGTPPTVTSAGAPNVAALTRADSAAHASALFPATPAAVFVETTPGTYTDPRGVYHSFSGASSDIPNPMQATIPTVFVYDSLYAVLAADTSGSVHGRFGKLMVNGANSPPFPRFNFAVTVPIGSNPTYWTTAKYQSPGDPIPIIRGEDLVLFDAVAQLGLGNTAAALTLINGIRTAAGEPAASPALTYVGIRNQLLEDIRMSTFLESGGDRTIMIRNYGMELVTDDTWAGLSSGDTHATVIPIPIGEASARNNNTAYSCP
jgi:hypothetical protein